MIVNNYLLTIFCKQIKIDNIHIIKMHNFAGKRLTITQNRYVTGVIVCRILSQLYGS